ncbi:hypothetical protein [Schleiferilactobacillus harbinensis]|uniref:hypothetical protein n=1 Tax=Schleiferilactobacillus harbinensis TaxID=304207 RepID=UPI001171189D|nr:hypothetical protein [Schleiferilactobacillus harbinensis]GEK04903.1 hypothetical protein LHA01_01420 [Schleiferilactobacillus harbinensis]
MNKQMRIVGILELIFSIAFVLLIPAKNGSSTVFILSLLIGGALLVILPIATIIAAVRDRTHAGIYLIFPILLAVILLLHGALGTEFEMVLDYGLPVVAAVLGATMIFLSQREKKGTPAENVARYYRLLPIVGIVTSVVLIALVRLVNGYVSWLGYLYCLLPIVVYSGLSLVHRWRHTPNQ